MSTPEQEPTEEQLRAAYEAEIKKIRVEHVLLENVVSLVNLGMRRTGQAPGTEDERDLAQVRLAIDAIRALLPVIERSFPNQVPPIRDALSQLQLAFVKLGGEQAISDPEGAEPGAASPGDPSPGDPASGQPGASPRQPGPAPQEPGAQPQQPGPEEPGPAQRSGRLWIPGQ
jgi:hypothetical protein